VQVNLKPEQSVRDVLLEYPAAAAVFEKHNIDYCCRGNRPLQDALSERGLSLPAFISEVGRTADLSTTCLTSPDWRVVPLRKLIRHIVDTHHVLLRMELPALDKWITMISTNHPGETELMLSLQLAIHRLQRNVEIQMSKEEAVLFPAISNLDTGPLPGISASGPPFGSVANLALVMKEESSGALGLLNEIRILSRHFVCRPKASAALRTLFVKLRVLEVDVHQHLHLENNILFPRAIRLEKEIQRELQ
jgi:regulator of cell morphogenesis and NO signaling